MLLAAGPLALFGGRWRAAPPAAYALAVLEIWAGEGGAQERAPLAPPTLTVQVINLRAHGFRPVWQRSPTDVARLGAGWSSR
jgi:hypothetical protein